MTKYVVQASWDEAPHLSPETRAQMESALNLRPHEREARIRGVPQLGSGAIYPVPESDIVIDPIMLPQYWPRAYAMDVGWNRTAALWGAYDPESDTIYFYSEHYRGHAEPPVHSEAIKARGAWINGVIDPASRGRQQADGQQLLSMYTELGLRLSPTLNAVEAGIDQMMMRLSTGRIKVFKTLVNFLMEYRIYRRDEKGKVVKENDHLMDCGRYFCLSGIGAATVSPNAYRVSARAEAPYDPFAPFGSM